MYQWMSNPCQVVSLYTRTLRKNQKRCHNSLWDFSAFVCLLFVWVTAPWWFKWAVFKRSVQQMNCLMKHFEGCWSFLQVLHCKKMTHHHTSMSAKPQKGDRGIQNSFWHLAIYWRNIKTVPRSPSGGLDSGVSTELHDASKPWRACKVFGKLEHKGQRNNLRVCAVRKKKKCIWMSRLWF